MRHGLIGKLFLFLGGDLSHLILPSRKLWDIVDQGGPFQLLMSIHGLRSAYKSVPSNHLGYAQLAFAFNVESRFDPI